MRSKTSVAFTGIVLLGALPLFVPACGGDDSTQASGDDASTGTDGSALDGTVVGDGGGGGDGTVIGDGSGTDGSTTGDGAQGDGAQGDGGPTSTASVYQHHKNGSRDGLYVDSVFTKAAAATTHVVSTFTGTVTGNIRAQPLYVENGPGGHEAFIVATESNHVVALDGTGAVVWDKTFGTPITGNLPCGNINPLGITGTPIIDIAARVIYFDAMTTPDNNATFKHMIYAIALDDGTTKTGWPVDVSAKIPTFDSRHQNQRGALQLVGGILYIPYGGHDGDCDPYFGWVVGVHTNDPTMVTSWHTSAGRGGIWASGSLPTDGTAIFAVTGNTEGVTTWGGGEAVIRLTAGPVFSGNTADYYAPTNWKNLDDTDLDLGGANDFLLDMPGAPKPHLVVAPGKDQNLYLINRDNLGGIGAELSKTRVATNEMNASGAAYTTAQGTYVALRVANGGTGFGCPAGGPTGGNLVVAKISAASPPVVTIAWCVAEQGLGSPIVTTTDGHANAIVWDANGSLWAYDGDTGAKIYTGGATTSIGGGKSMHIFNTPIAAKGRIVVAIDGKLVVFAP